MKAPLDDAQTVLRRDWTARWSPRPLHAIALRGDALRTRWKKKNRGLTFGVKRDGSSRRARAEDGGGRRWRTRAAARREAAPMRRRKRKIERDRNRARASEGRAADGRRGERASGETTSARRQERNKSESLSLRSALFSIFVHNSDFARQRRGEDCERTELQRKKLPQRNRQIPSNSAVAFASASSAWWIDG